jgi:hypothetical protein
MEAARGYSDLEVALVRVETYSAQFLSALHAVLSALHAA